MSRWKEYPDLLTDSLWLFPASGEPNDMHGAFIPQVVEQLLRRFTSPGEIVFDPFIGSGTTARVGLALGRRVIGIDIATPRIEKLAIAHPQEIAENRLALAARDSASAQVVGFLDDVERDWDMDGFHFALLHPPYHDIIKFSPDDRDLSNLSERAFHRAFCEVACLCHDHLLPGRFAALVIGDKYADGEWVPLGFHCMEAMQGAGFRLKSICVKDMQGNETGKGKDANLWRYRALAHNFYVFRHEYVMLFEKKENG